MPRSISRGLTHEHIIKAMDDLDTGIDHPFGKATGCPVVYQGRRCAPKAVIGVGFRHLKGEVLHHGEFSGGEAPGQANYELRRLGFVVETKNESKEEDGLGYDVLSFDETDDTERLIEVKTTNQGKFLPFYVSANEVQCSEALARQCHLYRLFRSTERLRLYVLHGSLSDLCDLDPVSYRAAVACKEEDKDA